MHLTLSALLCPLLPALLVCKHGPSDARVECSEEGCCCCVIHLIRITLCDARSPGLLSVVGTLDLAV